MTEKEYLIAKKEAKKRLILMIIIGAVITTVTTTFYVDSSLFLTLVLPVGFFYYQPVEKVVRQYEAEQEKLTGSKESIRLLNERSKLKLTKKDKRDYVIVGAIAVMVLGITFYEKQEYNATQKVLEQQLVKENELQKTIDEVSAEMWESKVKQADEEKERLVKAAIANLKKVRSFENATSFITSFLKNEDAEKRADYVEQKVSESARSLFTEQMTIASLPNVTTGHVSKATTSLGDTFLIVSEDQTVFYLVVQEEEKVTHVYGAGWEELPAEQFEQVKQELAENNPEEYNF